MDDDLELKDDDVLPQGTPILTIPELRSKIVEWIGEGAGNQFVEFAMRRVYPENPAIEEFLSRQTDLTSKMCIQALLKEKEKRCLSQS